MHVMMTRKIDDGNDNLDDGGDDDRHDKEDSDDGDDMMTMMMMRSNWQAWTCMPARGRAGHFAEPPGHSHDQNYRQDFHHDDHDDDVDYRHHHLLFVITGTIQPNSSIIMIIAR